MQNVYCFYKSGALEETPKCITESDLRVEGILDLQSQGYSWYKRSFGPSLETIGSLIRLLQNKSWDDPDWSPELED